MSCPDQTTRITALETRVAELEARLHQPVTITMPALHTYAAEVRIRAILAANAAAGEFFRGQRDA